MTDVSWAFNTQLMRNECHANVYTKAQHDARVRKNDIAQRYLRAAKLWNQAFRASTLEPSFTRGLFLFSTMCPAGWSHSLPNVNHKTPPPTYSYLPPTPPLSYESDFPTAVKIPPTALHKQRKVNISRTWLNLHPPDHSISHFPEWGLVSCCSLKWGFRAVKKIHAQILGRHWLAHPMTGLLCVQVFTAAT